MKVQHLNRILINYNQKSLKSLAANFSNNVSNIDLVQIKPKIDVSVLNRKFLTNQSNPKNHAKSDQGLFYIIPPEIKNTVFAVYGWNSRQSLIFETFNENAIMIRKYSLDIIEKIRNKEYMNENFKRLILHGKSGSGKTLSLIHLIHFANKSDIVTVHLNNILDLTRAPEEYKVSEYNKERVITPINGSLLLQHFKAQNEDKIKNLILSKTAEWSFKEKNEKGEPLINVINHGINRSDHSSDCYAFLLRELKIAADQNQIKLLIAIDDLNFLYWPTELRRSDYTYYTTKDVTITRAFRKLISSESKNSLLVASTDKQVHPRWDPEEQNFTDDPYDLLLEEGVKELKNFETIEVKAYENEEFLNCLAYYNDRNFLTHPKILTKEGIEQIKFLSTKLPKDVFELTKWL